MKGVVGIAIILIASTQSLVAATDPDIDGRADDGGLIVEGLGNDDSSAAPASSSSGSDDRPVKRMPAPLCVSTRNRADLDPNCPNGDPIVEYCIDGSVAELPLWERTQNPDESWTEWSIVQMYTCPGDAPLLAAIEHEWTELRPQPSDIDLQPNTGWVIATVPTIAMAGDAPRLHAATLLGANVDIRATASGYRWQWGDGSHTTTTDPGSPYPNASLTHTYPHASDAATVALTTTWTGEFRVNGGPWRNFDSTITSDSTPVDLTIYDPRSRLVSCDLEDNCRVDASG